MCTWKKNSSRFFPIKILLLLLLLYHQTLYAKILYIENQFGYDTKITIKTEHPSNTKKAIAWIYTRNNSGERVYLYGIVITPNQPLTIPLGMAATIYHSEQTEINTTATPIEAYAIPISTSDGNTNNTSVTNQNRITDNDSLRLAIHFRTNGIYRLMAISINENHPLYDLANALLPRIRTADLIPPRTPLTVDGIEIPQELFDNPTISEPEHFDERPLLLRDFRNLFSPIDVISLWPRFTHPDERAVLALGPAWNHLSGEFEYRIPHEIEERPYDMPTPFVNVQVYIQPDLNTAVEVLNLNLPQGAILPPIPGTFFNMIGYGYRELVPQFGAQTTYHPYTQHTLITGIRMMLKTIKEHGRHWKIYQQVINSIHIQRPELIEQVRLLEEAEARAEEEQRENNRSLLQQLAALRLEINLSFK